MSKINEAFTPIANWWEGLVLHNFPGNRKFQTIIFFIGWRSLVFLPFTSALLMLEDSQWQINTVSW